MSIKAVILSREHGLERLQAGEELLSRGSLDEAKYAFREAGDCGFAWGFVRVAEIDYRQGRGDEALVWMEKVEFLAANGDADANLW